MANVARLAAPVSGFRVSGSGLRVSVRMMPHAFWLLSFATATDLLFDFCLLRLFTIMPLALWLLGFATGGMANVARLAAPVSGFRV